jgi:hypothetical protein
VDDDPDTEIEDLLQAELDGRAAGLDVIKRGGKPVARPRDWWRLSVTDEVEQATEGETTDDPPVGFSHFELSLLRPDPLILVRARRQGLRKSDWWEFEFEGDPGLVRRQRALVMLTTSAFARDEQDDRRRDLRRWIALHYAARTSTVLTRCARQDAAERPPKRRFDRLDRDRAAAMLANDLHLHDRAFVRETLDLYVAFCEKINALPDESLARRTVDRFLGLKAHDEDDTLYAAMPDLTSDERAEMERLKDLAMRRELDPEGQARLLPLLKRHTAHVKARLHRSARSDNP